MFFRERIPRFIRGIVITIEEAVTNRGATTHARRVIDNRRDRIGNNYPSRTGRNADNNARLRSPRVQDAVLRGAGRIANFPYRDLDLPPTIRSRSAVEARSQRALPRPPPAISSPDKFIPARKRASGQLEVQRRSRRAKRKKRRDRLEISRHPLDLAARGERSVHSLAFARVRQTNERLIIA